jgi:hypothetical protein
VGAPTSSKQMAPQAERRKFDNPMNCHKRKFQMASQFGCLFVPLLKQIQKLLICIEVRNSVHMHKVRAATSRQLPNKLSQLLLSEVARQREVDMQLAIKAQSKIRNPK